MRVFLITYERVVRDQGAVRPQLEFSDVETGSPPDPTIWDVIRVPSDGSELMVIEGDDETPLSELVDRTQRSDDDSNAPFSDV